MPWPEGGIEPPVRRRVPDEAWKDRTDSDPDSWWLVLATTLRGPALLCRRLVPGMVARGRGHVVNVNSRAAVWDDPGQSSVAYSVSKAGLARFATIMHGDFTEEAGVAAAQAMVASGVLSAEDARGHPDSNKVLRSLGSQRDRQGRE